MDDLQNPSFHLRRALAQHLRGLQQAGVAQLPKPNAEFVAKLEAAAVRNPATEIGIRPSGQPVANSPTASSQEESMARKRSTAASEATPATSSTNPQGLLAPPIHSLPVLSESQRTSKMKAMSKEVAGCTRCAQLASTRTQTVFGVGNLQPKLCFLGEAPGADEDKQGIPFVGRAGQLLTDIIEKGMKIPREDVYILNVLKCRPPGNRNPLPDEVANCRGYLERQLEILRPKFICCLGAVAAQNLLETTVAVGKLRGEVHDWRGIKVVVTYHPSYLLRNPAAKKYTWEDIQMLMKLMD